MLVYFNRLGDAKFANKSSLLKQSLPELYYAVMYDYKFNNAFMQITLQEVLRFSRGSFLLENYLFSTVNLTAEG
jgi:hypothetical protein